MTTDQRFRRAERIRTRTHYKQVERNGIRKRSKHFIVFGLPNDLDWSRLGITVTRKVGGSPTRNWWKRRIKEAYRTSKQDVPISFDFVIIVRPRSSKPAYETLKIELTEMLNSVAENQ